MSVKRNSFTTSTTDFTADFQFQRDKNPRDYYNRDYQNQYQNQFQNAPQNPTQNPQPQYSKYSLKENRPIGNSESKYQPTTRKELPPQMPAQNLNSTFQMLPMMFSMDQDFFPQEIIYLLSEEDNHIQRLKSKIEGEKQKIKRDVQLVKEDVVNMFDDLSMQMQQLVDEHYKQYLNVYRIFKEEVVNFKQAKMEAPLNLVPPPPMVNMDECSNGNLIRELEEMRYKNYVSKVNAYVGELAKARIEGIQKVSSDLFRITSYDGNLYNSESTIRQLNFIKTEIEERLIQKFGNMLEYILPLDFIHRQKKQLDQSNINNNTNITTNSSANKVPQNTNTFSHPYLDNNNQRPQFSSPIEQPYLNPTTTQQPYLNPTTTQSQLDILTTHHLVGNVNDLKELSSLHTPHESLMLCFTHIKDNLTATASKDGMIKIWENQNCVATLSNHKGGICTLTTLRSNGIPYYLASGSDHGDNSIKIWDLTTLKEYNTLLEHQAAVVALLSLDDGQTLVSGSYDKSLLIWNVDTPKPIQKLNVHKNAITCLALGKGRFVSAGLDNMINIWKINYQPQGYFESAYLEKSLQNPTLVCSLNMVQVQNKHKILCGSKDGKIREYDMASGECTSTLNVGSKPIVEMIVVQEGVSYSIISMCNKDKNLILTSQGENRILDANVFVEFGCGVYPKMEVIECCGQAQLLLITQRDQNQEILRYQL